MSETHGPAIRELLEDSSLPPKDVKVVSPMLRHSNTCAPTNSLVPSDVKTKSNQSFHKGSRVKVTLSGGEVKLLAEQKRKGDDIKLAQSGNYSDFQILCCRR